jgi:hypothetical protein
MKYAGLSAGIASIPCLYEREIMNKLNLYCEGSITGALRLVVLLYVRFLLNLSLILTLSLRAAIRGSLACNVSLYSKA